MGACVLIEKLKTMFVFVANQVGVIDVRDSWGEVAAVVLEMLKLVANIKTKAIASPRLVFKFIRAPPTVAEPW